jgi:geranylgeranyl diphosphate synthase type II
MTIAAYPAMAAIEMVHTYSLIHDDLPCMDDDDLRRGRPTCHKRFNEAIATLAGDALHVVAFELVARTGSIEVVRELARSSGTAGMLGGQIADIEAEGRQVSRSEIEHIHRLKPLL